MTQLKAVKHEEPKVLPTFGTTSSTAARRIFQVDEGHKSKETAIKYRNNFDHFLNYIRIHDLDVLLDLGKEAIQELVIKYVLSMRDNVEKRYSRSTVNTNVSAILYFMENNDIELNRKKLRRYYPSDESTIDDRPYTREEIARVLSVCELREKAMILLMASSGVRIGSLCSMQKCDLTEVEFRSLKFYKVQVYARTRDKYIAFTTSECYNAIQDYLNFRKRCGEELKDKSPLFRKHFNKEDPFTINVPKPLRDVSVKKAIDGVLKKSGVKTSECMRSHAWRKGYKSICEQSGMKSINVELLMGHNIGVSGHYYRPAEADVLEDFMSNASDALTISDVHRLKKRNQELETKQAQEITRLKAQLEDKEQQLRHTVEALEIKSKNSIDKIEKQIVKLNDRIVEITTDNEHGTHYYNFKKA